VSSDRKIIVEQHKKFSECALWRMQREYFDQAGVNAWVNQVPFYITSNPFIANCYAQLVLAFIQDWSEKHPETKGQPFYIMELGTGSGRFSFYVIKMLDDLMTQLKLTDIKICYIMSDFTKNNIKYWETHPTLKPYVDRGLIDFAIFDMETEKPVTLLKSNVRLSPETLVNPLTLFANYIFDTVSHDSFAMHEHKLYELLLTLSTEENNMKNNRPVDMEKLHIDYTVHEIKGSSYYGDPDIDNILEEYKKTLNDTSFLIPIGSLRAIKYLKKLTNNKLFIISTDKGYGSIDSMQNLGHPSISFHGSFSMMVNFHAIGEYFKNSGGDAFLQTSRKGIKSAVFGSGFKFADMPRTAVAIDTHIEGFSPSDYFTMHRRMSDSFNECTLETISAHMQLAGWDPHIYLKMPNRITQLIAEEGDTESIQFMAANMHKLASNYYYMPKSECILFEIGVFFHAIKQYKDALNYYQQAIPFVGEQFGLFYNMALCQHHLDMKEDALKSFKKAQELDPSSKETEEWINFLEKGEEIPTPPPTE
jgi:tetratricopeptide (TPR) repeat protein